MFDEDLRIQFKSETGNEPYVELSEGEPLEEILMIAVRNVTEDFPLNEENYMSIPTREYLEWLEEKVSNLVDEVDTLNTQIQKQ